MNASFNRLFFLLVGIAPRSTLGRFVAASFVAPSSRRITAPSPTSPPSSTTATTTALSSSPLFSPEKNDEPDSSGEFDGFNPFQPGAKIPAGGGFGILSDEERRKRPPPSAPGGRISPRRMRMKELTTDLLARLSDEGAVSELLRSNEEFLLEQLNDSDAVLEPDSVFTPNMSREERFRRYGDVMDERIEGARAPAAKKALGALKDFVMSRE